MAVGFEGGSAASPAKRRQLRHLNGMVRRDYSDAPHFLQKAPGAEEAGAASRVAAAGRRLALLPAGSPSDVVIGPKRAN